MLDLAACSANYSFLLVSFSKCTTLVAGVPVESSRVSIARATKSRKTQWTIAKLDVTAKWWHIEIQRTKS